MKWDLTTASKCRWADLVEKTLYTKNMEIVYEYSNLENQGSVEFIGVRPDRTIVFYAWDYGSCPGCDAWESIPEKQITDSILKTTAFLSESNYRDYFKATIEGQEKIYRLDTYFQEQDINKYKRFSRIQYD